jgi:hypothetical protein
MRGNEPESDGKMRLTGARRPERDDVSARSTKPSEASSCICARGAPVANAKSQAWSVFCAGKPAVRVPEVVEVAES